MNVEQSAPHAVPHDPAVGLLVTSKEVMGAMAAWAVRQHPYNRPEGLFDVTDALRDAAQSWPLGPSELKMRRFQDVNELDRWIAVTLANHPVLTAWNTPRFGHGAPFVAVSRYFGPAPEFDFIDIGALVRNVAGAVWTDALAQAAEDTAWSASGEPEDGP